MRGGAKAAGIRRDDGGELEAVGVGQTLQTKRTRRALRRTAEGQRVGDTAQIAELVELQTSCSGPRDDECVGVLRRSGIESNHVLSGERLGKFVVGGRRVDGRGSGAEAEELSGGAPGLPDEF